MINSKNFFVLLEINEYRYIDCEIVIPVCRKLFLLYFKLSNIVLLNFLITGCYPAQGGVLCPNSLFFRMGGREVLKKFLKLQPRIRHVPPGDQSNKILLL